MALRSLLSARRMLLAILVVGSGFETAGCTATVSQSGASPPAGGGGGQAGDTVVPGSAFTMGASGLRRLSRIEYDNTLRDLLADGTRSGFAKLPEDVADPFDNDFRTQLVSGALIASAETLATEAAARVLADPVRRAALVGCTPTGPADAPCLDRFVTTFGARAFRRPLSAAEKSAYLALQSFAVEANDFYTAVNLILRAMLQDPSFLYRLEIGEPVTGLSGLFRLGDYEIATRLSYFLWGTTPSDALLEEARARKLSDAGTRRAAAATLLNDPQGRRRVASFHAFWLGYNQLPFPADLASALRAESDALVERVVFGGGAQDYFQLFRADGTTLTDALATHYGMPLPGSTTGAWVPYGQSPRRGILSHGSVLSAGAKFDDTSPTLRGVFVRNRLLCQDVPPPPPTVAVDEPPPASANSRCKTDRYAVHRSGGCAGCHNLTDSIGFGLENYDRAGRFRATDKDAPECAISGDGEVAGVGKFNGPAALGEMLIKTGNLERCVVTQAYRLAMGRHDVSGDEAVIQALTAGFVDKQRPFADLLLDMVSSSAFVHRRMED